MRKHRQVIYPQAHVGYGVDTLVELCSLYVVWMHDRNAILIRVPIGKHTVRLLHLDQKVRHLKRSVPCPGLLGVHLPIQI